MVRTVPAPRPPPVIKRIHGSDRKAAWEQPKASGLRVAAPFRNRERRAPPQNPSEPAHKRTLPETPHCISPVRSLPLPDASRAHSHPALSAWERIMLDSFDKNPTSTHVVNNAWKGNLREFNRRPFDDRGATYAEKKRQGGKQARFQAALRAPSIPPADPSPPLTHSPVDSPPSSSPLHAPTPRPHSTPPLHAPIPCAHSTPLTHSLHLSQPWWSFGFSGNVADMHWTRRQNFLREVYI